MQLSSPQSTLLPLKQSKLLAVLHAPLLVLNGLPIILQIVVLNVLTEKSVCVCSMLLVCFSRLCYPKHEIQNLTCATSWTRLKW